MCQVDLRKALTASAPLAAPRWGRDIRSGSWLKARRGSGFRVFGSVVGSVGGLSGALRGQPEQADRRPPGPISQSLIRDRSCEHRY